MSDQAIALPRARNAPTEESPAARGILIAVALVFLAGFLLLPLAVVFTEALGAGVRAYLAALADPDAVASIRMTLLVTALVVPANLIFGLAAAWAVAKFEFAGKSLLNTLIDLPNHATVTFGDSTLGLKGTGQILGIDVGYTAAVVPTVKDGDTVVLTPHSVSVTAGGGALDVTKFAKDLLPKSIPICVAEYLPKGVDVTGLSVKKGSASVFVQANDFVVDDASLQSKGTCG